MTNLQEEHWDTLVARIKEGRCTPFIGAGACWPVLPLGAQLAEELAVQQEGYPFADKADLARVTQYIAVKHKDGVRPKELVAKRFQAVVPPNSEEEDEPHRVLAELPLPIYLTTNYDDFMFQALRKRGKDARREVCRWNKALFEEQSSVFDSGFDPTPASPVVFHLHGHADLDQSIVITEDDYLDFLVNISKDLGGNPTGLGQKAMLPPRIRSAIKTTTLLFIGYGLADLNFRVILRGLLSSLERSSQRLSITVQLRPKPEGAKEEDSRVLERYMAEYFGWTLNLLVYWGSAREFACELRQRI